MDLKKFNQNFEFYPLGFKNIGSTCYYNALLQALLSCTALSEELLNSKFQAAYKNNEFCKSLIILLQSKLLHNYVFEVDEEKQERLEMNIHELAPRSWKALMFELSKESDIKRFSSGQQDAFEGFNLLLQGLEK